MPTRPKFRKTPGYEATRKTTAQRGYGAAWQRTRVQVLKRQPLCVDCEEAGRTTIAEEVHHVAKIKDRPDLRLQWDNLMPLCKACHEARTRRGE